MAFITIELLSYFTDKLSKKITEIFVKKSDMPKSLPANGGDAATVGGHTVETNVPVNAKFTDTIYSHPDTAGNKHIPTGGTAGQILKWSANGTAVWGADTNTTYPVMTGATSSAAGKSGLVPVPAIGKQASYLRGDGTWTEIAEASTSEIDSIISGTFSS